MKQRFTLYNFWTISPISDNRAGGLRSRPSGHSPSVLGCQLGAIRNHARRTPSGPGGSAGAPRVWVVSYQCGTRSKARQGGSGRMSTGRHRPVETSLPGPAGAAGPAPSAIRSLCRYVRDAEVAGSRRSEAKAPRSEIPSPRRTCSVGHCKCSGLL